MTYQRTFRWLHSLRHKGTHIVQADSGSDSDSESRNKNEEITPVNLLTPTVCTEPSEPATTIRTCTVKQRTFFAPVGAKNVYVDVYRRSSHSLAKNSKENLKILGVRRVIHSQYPQVSGATAENLVATATRRQGFVHLCDYSTIWQGWLPEIILEPQGLQILHDNTMTVYTVSKVD